MMAIKNDRESQLVCTAHSTRLKSGRVTRGVDLLVKKFVDASSAAFERS